MYMRGKGQAIHGGGHIAGITPARAGKRLKNPRKIGTFTVKAIRIYLVWKRDGA